VSEQRQSDVPASAGMPASGPGSLPGASRAITAFALALGTFMQVLDTTIANVSIPTIAGDLAVSPNQGTWVITSFAVANGISLPLTGWLMQRFGVVRTFVTSVALFTAASFLCGIASSLPALVACRILQGAVSGPMIPGSQALLIAIFPPQRRGLALAIWSMTTLIAPIAGPLLGGYISDNYSWPWIFFINLPVGVVACWVCWHHLGRRDTPTRRLPVDYVGLGLLVVWVGALQIMLDQGKELDWFNSSLIIGLAIAAAIGFLVFLIWELTERHPIVDLSLLRNSNFALGCTAMCLGYAVFFANLLLFTLLLQTQLGYTATWAGLASAPAGIVAFLLSPLVGKSLTRIDARWLVTAAFIAFAVSYFLRASLNSQATFGDFVVPLMWQGLAMSSFFVAILAIQLNGLAPERIPQASGLSNFLRITGGSFAASIVTTLWDRREALHQTRLVETRGGDVAPYIEHLRQLGLPGPASLRALARTVVSQAYMMSAIDIFWISGWLCLVILLLVWLTRSTKGSGAPVAAAE
jgi:MFS transporter, DHA2 family, multidrug resistance protein